MIAYNLKKDEVKKKYYAGVYATLCYGVVISKLACKTITNKVNLILNRYPTLVIL